MDKGVIMNSYFKQQNLKILEDYFRNGCKLNCIQKLGMEIEHIIVHKDTKKAVTYYESHGIGWLLAQLKSYYPHFIYEQDSLLGLSNADYSISLEPAAQFEISITPREDIRTIMRIYRSFLNIIQPILDQEGYELWNIGYQPESHVDDLPLIPKKRYRYMDRYFRTSGTRGRNMMRGTAATQISIDYCSEEDFVRKYRTAYLIMPAIRLLTDNTPMFEGKPWPGHLVRTKIWDNVDPKRCGSPDGLFDDNFSFHTYAEYLWNMPPVMKPEDGDFVFSGEDRVSDIWGEKRMTPEDVEHIISMTFVDVRLKNYVEIRGADSMPAEYMMAYLALVKGVFFEQEVAQGLLSRYPITIEDIHKADQSLSRDGYQGEIYGVPANQFTGELLEMAKDHLTNGEEKFLDPFILLVNQKTTLAAEYQKKNLRRILK